MKAVDEEVGARLRATKRVSLELRAGEEAGHVALRSLTLLPRSIPSGDLRGSQK